MQALVKRFEGQPFDILGINTDSDKELFRKNCVIEGVTWRSTWEGDEQAVVKKWGVSVYPTIYILDAEGRIRFKDSRGEGLERDVAALMAELEEEPILKDAEDGEAGFQAAEPRKLWKVQEATGTTGDSAGDFPVLDFHVMVLLDEHAAADAEWKEAMLELRGKERRALKKLDPASKFLTDFQKTADAGNGRAKLWLAMNMAGATDMKSSELKAAITPLYSELCYGYAMTSFASEILDAVIKEKRRLDPRDRADFLGGFSVNSTDHALQARAIGEMVAYYGKSKDKDDIVLAAELTEKLYADYLDTSAGVALWGARNEGAFEGVGSEAPDFPAIDTDGEPFRLSDYKGQVVMLDFWGFW